MKEFGLRVIGLLLVLSVVHGGGVPEAVNATKAVDTFNTRRANMNEYMEYVLDGVGDWMRAGGVTPFDLPDLREGFAYKPLLIEYSGWVDLSKGRLLDIEKVVRAGDCFMSYDRLLLRIDVEVALTTIKFNYDYKTTIMGLGVFEGLVTGSADNMVVTCEFLIDMYDFYIFMQDFKVKSIGRIDVRLSGNMLTDWIGNIMLDLITVVFKRSITEMVSDRVKVFMQQALDEMNASRQAAAGQNRSTAGHAYSPLYEVVRAAMVQHGIQLPQVDEGGYNNGGV